MLTYAQNKKASREAEERVKKAQALRFNPSGLLDDRSASPAPPRQDQLHRVRQPSPSPSSPPAVLRSGNLLDVFNSDYSGSTTSHDEIRNVDLDLPPRSHSAPRSGFNAHRSVHQHQLGPSAAEYIMDDGHDDLQAERPNSQSSEFNRCQEDAERVLQEQRQRRLATQRINKPMVDSYPSTTSGRISTPDGFRRPSFNAPTTPSPTPQPPAEPDNSSTIGREESLDCHRSVYIRQAANNYHRQHQQQHHKVNKQTSPRGPNPNMPPQNARPVPVWDVVGDQRFDAAPAQSSASYVPQYRSEQLKTADGDALQAAPKPDYEEAVLFAMPFSELRDESFDIDPSAAPELESMASSEPTSSLSDRLAAALEGDKSEQEALLKRLPASDWAAVDAWFTSQFAELAKERTAKRKERRDIARHFEAKVAEQYERTDAEHKDLKEAMRKMQSSGAQVLRVSTPARKRRANE